MSNRYFVDGPLVPGELDLEGPEAHHLLHVMRAKPGQRVVLFCGDGTEAGAEVLDCAKRSVLLRVDPAAAIDRELPGHLHIATAFPKGDRADLLIEKLTELGAAELTPLNTERSVNRIRDDKLDKLRRQVIEASKQCGRNRLMAVNGAADWGEFVGRRREGSKWILHPGNGPAGDSPVSEGSNTFCIGPEGGFSVPEVRLAVEAGWEPISFGPRILRTETACIASVAVIASARARM